MPIDGIGKKGGIGAGPDVTGGIAPAPRAGGTSFDAKIDRAEKTEAIAPAATTPLDRLKSGDITLEKYLDIKVDEATKHLATLPASDMADIREMLRDRIASDPMLVDLVKQATGSAPTPRDD